MLNITNNSLKSQLLHHRTLQYSHQILPVHAVALHPILILELQQHEPVATREHLLVDVVGVVLVMDHLHLSPVPGHEHEHVTVVRVVVGRLADYLEKAVVPAAHIRHARDIIEILQARYRQHSTSSFSTNFTNPS